MAGVGMRTGVFLQVRLSSTRLARKALLKLGNSTILEWCLKSLGEVKADEHAILTDAQSYSEFQDYAHHYGWSLFSGDPNNVLDRYVSAARHFDVNLILRATGDNPLVSPQIATTNMQQLEAGGWDLYALAHSPLGTGTEAVRRDALELALQREPNAYDQEHVTPFLYRHPEDFRVGRPTVPPQFYLPEARLTIDTQEDLDRVADLVQRHALTAPVDTEFLVGILRDYNT